MNWHYLISFFRLKRYKIIFLLSCLFLYACNSTEENTEITLKWNPSYPDETIEDAIIGLKWCLSFLGASDAKNNSWKGIKKDGNLIRIAIDSLQFSDTAITYLSELNAQIKQSEEYKNTGAILIGRYMALTIGSSYHYYKIAGVPQTFKSFKKNYTFQDSKGYINNSGVSKVHRIIDYATNMTEGHQAYISTEIDSITKSPIEYETVEVMPNGLSRFGLYDLDGNLKDVADSRFTKAGKPGKCMWCHESVIQPLFKIQLDFPGYLTYENFSDTLTHYALGLRHYQKQEWKDKELLHKPNNTKMELTYIAFMEPSAKYLSSEWNMSEKEVLERIGHLTTHKHKEFNFLGDLYHRKDIDPLAPWKVQEVPESIREKSKNELSLLGD